VEAGAPVSRPEVSVVVVNLNGRKHLEHLLPALAAQDLPTGAVEVVLVDNGSTDDSLALAAKKFPDTRFIPLRRNYGFATANTEGIKAARGRHIALVNNDMKVPPDWLRHFLDQAEEGTVLAGRILDWDGRRIDFVRGLLTFDGHAFQEGQGLPVSQAPPPEAVPLPFPCGGNCFFGRDLYLATGGFDADYFAYLEDVDWGRRLWMMGHRVIACPGAVARHRGSATGLKLGMFKRAFLFEKNAFMTFYKNMEEPFFRALLPAVMMAWEHRIAALMKADPGTHPLALDPYRQKVKSDTVRIKSPHLVNHLRAFRWIHENLHALGKKRRQVQAGRKASDVEYFKMFPLHLVPTYPGDDLLFTTPAFLELLPAEPAVVSRALGTILHP
jgi:GT2 family glycosyltransferase